MSAHSHHRSVNRAPRATGNDKSGLVHLAASHDVPVVVLFGPTDPNRWSPWTPRATVVRSALVRRPLLDRLGLRGQRPHPAWDFGTAVMDEIVARGDFEQRCDEDYTALVAAGSCPHAQMAVGSEAEAAR